MTVEITDRWLLTDTALITVNVTDVGYAPVLAMVKTGPATAEVGKVVTYTFTLSHAVSSDGSPVSTVVVTDSLAGAATYVSGDMDSDGALDADEMWMYTAVYTIRASDPSPLINEGRVTAEDLDGNTVSATATHSTAIGTYTLTVVTVGSGTVTKAPDQATYRYGESVVLTATAAPGWSFSGWSGAAAGTARSVTVLLDSNKAVTATFTNAPASIVVDVSANPTTVHEPGETVTFTVWVDNTSAADTVNLTTLSGDVYGNMNGQGSCSVPRSIAAGGSYTCASAHR